MVTAVNEIVSAQLETIRIVGSSRSHSRSFLSDLSLSACVKSSSMGVGRVGECSERLRTWTLGPAVLALTCQLHSRRERMQDTPDDDAAALVAPMPREAFHRAKLSSSASNCEVECVSFRSAALGTLCRSRTPPAPCTGLEHPVANARDSGDARWHTPRASLPVRPCTRPSRSARGRCRKQAGACETGPLFVRKREEMWGAHSSLTLDGSGACPLFAECQLGRATARSNGAAHDIGRATSEAKKVGERATTTTTVAGTGPGCTGSGGRCYLTASSELPAQWRYS